jgi:GDSL-like Lipase/Acylhydrolase family
MMRCSWVLRLVLVAAVAAACTTPPSVDFVGNLPGDCAHIPPTPTLAYPTTQELWVAGDSLEITSSPPNTPEPPPVWPAVLTADGLPTFNISRSGSAISTWTGPTDHPIPSITATVKDYLSRWSPCQPVRLIIAGGTNDFIAGKTASFVEASLVQNLVPWLTQVAPNVQVDYLTVPPGTPSGAGPVLNAPGKRLEWNDWLRHTNQLGGGVIDCQGSVADPSNPDFLNPAFDVDGLHFNQAGHVAYAHCIEAWLASHPV